MKHIVRALFRQPAAALSERGPAGAAVRLFRGHGDGFFRPARHHRRRGPTLRDSLDVKRYMAIVVFILLPLLFFGIYNAGYQSRLASGLRPDLLAVPLAGRGCGSSCPW